MGGVGSGRKKASVTKKEIVTPKEPSKAAVAAVAKLDKILGQTDGIWSQETLLDKLDYAQKVDRGKIANIVSARGSHDQLLKLEGRLSAWQNFASYLEGNENALD